MSTIGFNATLIMGANALAAQRAAVEVTGQNIANVNTPNYARQRVPLKADFSVKSQIGQQGIGVFAGNIEQLRSALLDRQIPGNISTFSYLDEKSNRLGQVITGLGQSLDSVKSLATTATASVTGGLAEALDSFFNAFQRLATEPTSATLRQEVILNAQNVARKLNSISTNLTTVQTQITSQVVQDISDVNTALTGIARLNSQIASIEVGGLVRANDLRDARQQAVEELSKKIDLFTQEQSDGTLTVRLGSATGGLLVSGVFSGNTASAATFKLAVDGAAPTLDIKGWTGGEAETVPNLTTPPVLPAPQPTGGTVAARIEMVNTVIGGAAVGLIQDYNRIAAALAALINPQHAAGFNLQGSPAYATAGNATFFDNNAAPLDPLGVVTAANIQLNSAVAADIREIAASSAAGQPNNGANASLISQIRNNTTGPGLGGITVSSYYLTSLTGLGVNLRINDNRKSTQELLNQQLNQQRDSVMGVSIDEEMTNLIRFQNAFTASARIITTIDEMIQTVVNLKR